MPIVARINRSLTGEIRSGCFNGQIYNYLELRAELSNYEFRTRSDTEVIIALYVTHGLEGLKRLRGMFGLVIVDARARRVYLVRDQIGKKPLFLARWSDGLYFGSSLLALLATSDQEPRIANGAAADFWEHAHVAYDQSVLEGCGPVLPGQVIEQLAGCSSAYWIVHRASTEEYEDLGMSRRVSELIQQG